MTGEGEDASATSAAPKEEAKAPAAEPKEQADVPAPESAEPHQKETGARDLVAAVEKTEVKDPDVPEGIEMVRMTVREALRDAMAEEMRKADRVLVMGEDVAEYQGASNVPQGLLDDSGDTRGI